MDRLAAMRVFVEIVDRGSLTAAADALERSQPTIVRTLAALEQHLGVRLLQRTTRRMSLTPEGRDYLERCRRILADVTEAEAVLGDADSEPQGELRVTAPLQFGQRYVAAALTSFLRRYPRVTVDLLLLDRNVDLVEEGIDLALRIGRLADSSMVATRIGEVRRVVCASPTLLAATGRPQTPTDLASLPCIRQQNLPRSGAWPLRDAGREIVVRVDGRFRCNQIAAAITACAEGAGFAQFLSYQVREPVRDGRLEIVLPEFEPAPLPVSLVYPGGRLVSGRLRAMLGWLRGSLAESDAFDGVAGAGAAS